MTNIILLLIWSLICVCVGFYYAQNKTPSKTTKVPTEPNEEDVRKLKRQLREYQNFLNYDGTEQEGFND